ncbi:MAG: hypothetical protein EBV06_09120 [Planctomycetia bacterium]|nr:hypothetical protein [Planctomycetia bacterium]
MRLNTWKAALFLMFALFLGTANIANAQYVIVGVRPAPQVVYYPAYPTYYSPPPYYVAPYPVSYYPTPYYYGPSVSVVTPRVVVGVGGYPYPVYRPTYVGYARPPYRRW